MKTHTLFTLSSVIACAIFSVAACSPYVDPTESKLDETPGAPTFLEHDGVTLEILNIAVLESYQTHYIMNYPPEGDYYIRIEARISGIENPETWGQRYLTIGDSFQRWAPEHVRRVLIGEGYEYTRDEDYTFHYQFFFSVPEVVQPTSLAVFIANQEASAIAQLYAPPPEQRSANLSARPSEGTAGEFSIVAGGSSNAALATHTTVSGGQYNRAAVAYATVGGGRENIADYLYATIGGGYGNLASGRESAIAGGSRNAVSGDHAAIIGGVRNQATASDSVVTGGAYNTADEIYAAVGGGTRNLAAGTAAVVCGGAGNTANGAQSSITGGLSNRSSGAYSAILGGHQNSASGAYSVVLGGFANQAAADFSTALGRASLVGAEHSGAFLYADSSDAVFQSQNPNEFAVRATGGVRLVSAIDPEGEPSAGVSLPAGSGAWEIMSSRIIKNNLQHVQTDQILASLKKLPVYTWSYRSDPGGALHIGPTAEDFHNQFSFGADSSTIATVDPDGVALAAIQETARLIDAQQSVLSSQTKRLRNLETELEQLRNANGSLLTLNAVLLGISLLLMVKSFAPSDRTHS